MSLSRRANQWNTHSLSGAQQVGFEGYFHGENQPMRKMVLKHDLGKETGGEATDQEIDKYLDSLRNAIDTKYTLLRKAFMAADADRSNYLSKEEIVDVVQHFAFPIPKSHIHQIFTQVLDKDGDGKISYSEFCEKLKICETPQ
jgi:hypothetical protein